MKTPEHWDVEDDAFWQQTGKKIANRNLWISIPNLLCGFAVWLYWGMIVVRMQALHEADATLFAFKGWRDGGLAGDAYRALLYTLPAVAGLAGATLRIPNSFMIAISGGRNVKFITSVLLILPALGTGLALQDPDTSFVVFVALATLSGIGGGAFASSMSNISFFFPKRVQGLSLGLNAGLGNLGVSVMQFLIPWVITFGLFGGEPRQLKGADIWLQNAGLVWVPVLVVLAGAAWFLMNNLPQHKCGPAPVALGKCLWLELLGLAGAAVGVVLLVTPWGGFPVLLKIFVVLVISVLVTLALMRWLTPKATKDSLVDQFAIFKDKHNWIMTWLYTMTFGSFIGYAMAFPKLITDVFGYIRVDADGKALAFTLGAGESTAITTASGAVVQVVNKTAEAVTYHSISNPNAIDAFKYAFLGAMVGALIRPVGGWISDKWGGARVTHWDTLLMILFTIGCGWTVSQANSSPEPETFFALFLGLFLALFITTGIGNGSTFRMIPIIFEKAQAGPVLGWTSAVAAYGAFLIPRIFATQIEAGTPEYALYGFAAYYLSCLVVNWWFYARKGAEKPC